ncbi:MAG: hypothetical protein WA741_25845, partial [Candidatus Sulfotelmatobacter sp.]
MSALVDRELQRITDGFLAGRLRELLVHPYAVERAWDYGAVNEHFTCWAVLEYSGMIPAIRASRLDPIELCVTRFLEFKDTEDLDQLRSIGRITR